MNDLSKKCKRCNKFFNSIEKLQEHNLIKCEKSYKCFFCNKDFKNNYRLKRHLSNKTPCYSTVKEFRCPFCQNTFTQSGSLGRHMKSYCKKIDQLSSDERIKNILIEKIMY